jgi:hypothetical protein
MTSTSTSTSTGPVTSTGHLTLAAENIRQAMNVDGPATPPEIYDQIGALVDITSRLQQHLNRCAHALDKASHDERLRSTDATLTPEQLTVETRATMWKLRVAAEKNLRSLVRELNLAWSELSGLSLADAEADDVVDAEILDVCPSCASAVPADRGYVPGSTGLPVTCPDEWHEDEDELLHGIQPATDVPTTPEEIERRAAGRVDPLTRDVRDGGTEYPGNRD